MVTMIDQIGGEPTVRVLVDHFYDLIETLPEGAHILRLHLRGHGVGHVRAEQFDFLTGFFGGRRSYAERHGHMDLREIHAHVPIRREDADNWLHCMALALRDAGIQEPMRGRIFATLARAARMLVNHPAEREKT